MPKKHSKVWNYFVRIEVGSYHGGKCKFCSTQYVTNATRMQKHLMKCVKCPKQIKDLFKKTQKNSALDIIPTEAMILRPTPAQSSQQARPAAQQAQPQPAAAEAQPNQAQAGPNPFQPGMNPFQVLGGGTGAPNSPNATNGANSPLFVPPFPPFPFMPFMAPPPMPPANMRVLTTEELRRMEGNERANIEARIQCLRNIQVMLDASVMMMQQYCAAAALSTPTPATTSTTSQQTEDSQEQPSCSSPPETETEIMVEDPALDPLASDSFITIKTEPIGSPSSSGSSMPTSPVTVKIEPTPSTSNAANGETDELRRRRLQHFEQQQLQ